MNHRGQGGVSAVLKIPRGKLNRDTERLLIASAAGRCEFRGCNEFLYAHPLTGEVGNFAEKAHVVAYRKGGPRGDHPDRPADIDNLDNLMLLCRRDHNLIDDDPRRYTVGELKAHKREHEARIKRVTGLGPSMQTTVLQFTARIGGCKPAIGRSEIAVAAVTAFIRAVKAYRWPG